MGTCITLTVVEGAHRGEEMTCVGLTQFTIGRSEECTFPLRGIHDDLLVSRRHCLIVVHPDWVEIRDLESRNGTYVNGRRLGFPLGNQLGGSTAFKRRLQDGDTIRVGTSQLLVGIREIAEYAAHLEGVELLPSNPADA